MATDLVAENKSFRTSVAFKLRHLHNQSKYPSEQKIMIIISKPLNKNNVINDIYTLHPVPKGNLPEIILSSKEYIELIKHFDEPSKYYGVEITGPCPLSAILNKLRAGKLARLNFLN
jgi:hypothetical protein